MATDIFKDLEFDGKAIKHARLVNCVLPSGKSVEEVEKAAESVGDLDDLDTTNKSSLVSAINELKALVDTLSQTVETLSKKVEGVTIDLTGFTLGFDDVEVTSAIPAGYEPKIGDKVIYRSVIYLYDSAVLGPSTRNVSFGYQSYDLEEADAIRLRLSEGKWSAAYFEK